jgi:hypothetical protein
MNNEPIGPADDLQPDDLRRATAAIRASAAAVTPSAHAVQAMLERLGAAQCEPRAAQALASGRGSLSLTEDALMKKWRFQEAFRPLSFEALERRRLLAATTLFQDDGSAEHRWPDGLWLPVIHARGERPQRRYDGHDAPLTDTPADGEGSESPALGRLDALWSSAQIFGSELIFAA